LVERPVFSSSNPASRTETLFAPSPNVSKLVGDARKSLFPGLFSLAAKCFHN
jgi:hypothetical protein